MATTETNRYPSRGQSENVMLKLSAVDCTADDGTSVAVYFDRPARVDGLCSGFYEVTETISGTTPANFKVYVEFKANPSAHDSNDDWYAGGEFHVDTGNSAADTTGGGVSISDLATAVGSYPLVGKVISNSSIASLGSGPVPVYGIRLRFEEETVGSPDGTFDFSLTFGVEY